MVTSTHTVIVDAISRQGEGNLAFHLLPINGGELPAFDAGAHIDVHLPGGLIRQYSIASCSSQRHQYVICVKKEAASRGGSRAMHEQIRVGDRLEISSPRNLFALQPANYSILLAAGIGITPLLSMAESLDKQQQPFELHYYTSHSAGAAFGGRLQQGFSHGRAQLWCSDQGFSARQHLPDVLQLPQAGTLLYLCGPAAFMAHMQQQAMALGWQATHIHQEAFAPVAMPATNAGTGAEAFNVTLASTGLTLEVEPHQSIAQALQATGVNVPLSCEMGICGACLTRVIAGQPDHRDSVQSDAEKTAEQQYIALCCSRSLSPALVLDM